MFKQFSTSYKLCGIIYSFKTDFRTQSWLVSLKLLFSTLLLVVPGTRREEKLLVNSSDWFNYFRRTKNIIKLNYDDRPLFHGLYVWITYIYWYRLI